MHTVKASEFKAKCLQLMDDVARTGEPLIITKNGVPVAQLAPIKQKPPSLLAMHDGQIDVLEDIIEPVGEDWEAET